MTDRSRDHQRTKILFRQGEKVDLPRALQPGELGFVIDDRRLFIGPDVRYGHRSFGRDDYPFQNIEILTEQSENEFSKMHSERMREGTFHDYYEARMEPDTLRWTNVQPSLNGRLFDYNLPLFTNITAFIDYTVVADESGEVIRKGKITVWCSGGNTTFTDEASHSRDPSLIGRSSYDPRDVFGRVKFRFHIDGRNVYFQYKNWSFDAHTLNFKVSRPRLDDIVETQVMIYSDIQARTEQSFLRATVQINSNLQGTIPTVTP